MPSTIEPVALHESTSSTSSVPTCAASGEQLGEAIAELAARLHAATYELLMLLHRFDATGAWSNGFRSCAHWLSWRTGIDLGAARQKVRVARALTSLPRISAAMARGELSYAKVRALTRVATLENEAQLLDIGRAGTASHVETLVRAWRRVDRHAAARLTEQQHLHREVTTWVDDDGMVIIRGRLTPEIGAVVLRALEAATDRLHQESRHAPDGGRLLDELAPTQRRADALGRLAECALATDLDRGSAGDRYQVVLHVEAATVQTDVAGGSATDTGQAVLEVGATATSVSAETAQRFACDAALVIMAHAPDGSVLDVGRKRRTIPPALRRALEARDGGCRFPGCTARRCDVHHLRPWATGGGTSLQNTALLCRSHHMLVHEGGFGMRRADDGMLAFFRPNGTRIDAAPPAPRWEHAADPLGPTVARLAAAGVTLSPQTTRPHWDGHPFDVVWAIDVLRGREPAGRAAPSARHAGRSDSSQTGSVEEPVTPLSGQRASAELSDGTVAAASL